MFLMMMRMMKRMMNRLRMTTVDTKNREKRAFSIGKKEEESVQ